MRTISASREQQETFSALFYRPYDTTLRVLKEMTVAGPLRVPAFLLHTSEASEDPLGSAPD